MPAFGGWSIKPHDGRAFSGSGTFQSNANWIDGYLAQMQGGGANLGPWNVSGITLGDGDEVFACVELAIDESIESWSRSTDEVCFSLSSQAAVGNTLALELYRTKDGSGNVGARVVLTDKNGTTHATGWWYGISKNINAPDNVYAYCKRYQSGGTWYVDVILRVNGTNQATLTASAITGATKTLDFHLVHGQHANAKGETGYLAMGAARLHTTATVDSGSSWTTTTINTLIDTGSTSYNVKARKLATAAAQTMRLNAVGFVIYYASAGTDFGTWPANDHSAHFDWLLPDGNPDETDFQNAGGGTASYTDVDDVFGSYSTADYNTSTSTTAAKTQAYQFPSTAISGDIGFIGVWGNPQLVAPEADDQGFVLEYNGVESAFKPTDQVLDGNGRYNAVWAKDVGLVPGALTVPVQASMNITHLGLGIGIV